MTGREIIEVACEGTGAPWEVVVSWNCYAGPVVGGLLASGHSVAEAVEIALNLEDYLDVELGFETDGEGTFTLDENGNRRPGLNDDYMAEGDWDKAMALIEDVRPTSEEEREMFNPLGFLEALFGGDDDLSF